MTNTEAFKDSIRYTVTFPDGDLFINGSGFFRFSHTQARLIAQCIGGIVHEICHNCTAPSEGIHAIDCPLHR